MVKTLLEYGASVDVQTNVSVLAIGDVSVLAIGSVTVLARLFGMHTMYIMYSVTVQCSLSCSTS